MQGYLHLQLRIPLENQDSVVGFMTGEYTPIQKAVIPPPPKATVIVPESKLYKTLSIEIDKTKHQPDSARKVNYPA